AGCRGPCAVELPLVCTGSKAGDRGQSETRAIFEIFLKKRGLNVAAEIVACRMSGVQRAPLGLYGVAIAQPTAVIPRSEHKEEPTICVVRCERGVFSLRAPHVLLVPVAADEQRGHGDLREMRLNRHCLPERRIRWLGNKGAS